MSNLHFEVLNKLPVGELFLCKYQLPWVTTPKYCEECIFSEMQCEHCFGKTEPLQIEQVLCLCLMRHVEEHGFEHLKNILNELYEIEPQCEEDMTPCDQYCQCGWLRYIVSSSEGYGYYYDFVEYRDNMTDDTPIVKDYRNQKRAQ